VAKYQDRGRAAVLAHHFESWKEFTFVNTFIKYLKKSIKERDKNNL
jgi:hypothetical protein